ncbi:MAG: phoU [Ignavibacteria bacterium]|nr:phoU [Ignavibacteria bacterium]
MKEHVFKKYDEELNKLRYRLVKMGTIVQQQISIAINALLDNNLELAAEVLSLEKKVNKLDNKINNQCIKIIALLQPVATDLRLILAAYQMNIYLEIIADLTIFIIQDVMNMLSPPGLVEKTKIKDMAETIDSMISKLMDSFVDLNYELAIETIKMAESADEIFNSNFEGIKSLMLEDKNYIAPCCYLLDINRNFHAISQQTKSIAQELIYMFDSRIVKHHDVNKLINLSNEESV